MITVLGVIIQRIRRPDLERSYKTFLFPITPILYLLIGAVFCILLIIYKPQYTWPGFILVLIGVPVYFFARNNKRAELDE